MLCSDFRDIFNVNHFINSLRDEVKIIKKLPDKVGRKTPDKSVKETRKKKSVKGKVSRGIFYMHPVSWSSEQYYLNQVSQGNLFLLITTYSVLPCLYILGINFLAKICIACRSCLLQGSTK